ncbi:putative O-methyl transferase B [Rosellinia necatrix]|uniref:Putative O-methyl transferase B n=1 Tax=Rosellinia necatrix TaxID=77044 RepID=A0A1W2TAU5_ROSNE|nr:putative O-methyl transferase B [Rosellinia necatrix]
MPSEMDAALSRVRGLIPVVDAGSRPSLIAALHEIAYSLETPDDTLHRYGAMNLQTAVVEIGFDLGLFKFLAERGIPTSLHELSATIPAEPLLLGRLLKYLAAIGVVQEIECDQYAANHLTRNLSTKVAEAGISHYFATVSPQYQVLPDFLKRTGYKTPTDGLHTAFQDAWKTSADQFSWFAEHPENLEYFNNFMAFRREPQLSWLAVYPVKEEVRDWDPKKPVYVNIGGGIGHQCAQFLEKYPEVPGRVILQDLPHSVDKALPTPRVENVAHDFFEPQPIKGAKFYHMRGVLHNHPPSRVQKLLENMGRAMDQESILLLDEMILPDTKANVDAVSLDITMLSAFAGMERTEAQWRLLIKNAGLRLVNIYLYNPVSHESVMDVRLP